MKRRLVYSGELLNSNVDLLTCNHCVWRHFFDEAFSLSLGQVEVQTGGIIYEQTTNN